MTCPRRKMERLYDTCNATGRKLISDAKWEREANELKVNVSEFYQNEVPSKTTVADRVRADAIPIQRFMSIENHPCPENLTLPVTSPATPLTSPPKVAQRPARPETAIPVNSPQATLRP